MGVSVDHQPARPLGKPVLACLRGQVRPRPPVWLMRQAGRYLPEYRAVRASVGGFLELCYTPDLATEVTLQPIRRFGFDAAILFSDILVVPDALGIEVRFVEGEGPRLRPVRDLADLAALRPEKLRGHLAPVFETLRRLRVALPAEVTLLGFAGAPWTLAAYAIEGGSSPDFAKVRAAAREKPALVDGLIEHFTAATVDYLGAQAEAGAEAVQLFDSWAGLLTGSDLERWCVAPARRIVGELRARHPDLPVMLFPRAVGPNVRLFGDLGAQALSLDMTMSMDWAARHLPQDVCLQGNLDPAALLGSTERLLAEAQRVVAAAAGRSHIFNLGHGIQPESPPERVAELVAYLKSIAA